MTELNPTLTLTHSALQLHVMWNCHPCAPKPGIKQILPLNHGLLEIDVQIL